MNANTSPNLNSNNYVYLYLEPGHFARYKDQVTDNQLELYKKDTGAWVKLGDDPSDVRFVNRLREDSTQITYEKFLKWSSAK